MYDCCAAASEATEEDRLMDRKIWVLCLGGRTFIDAQGHKYANP